MNAQGIEEFLLALGEPQSHVEGGWVQASCPLAFSRHKAGRDNRPSFGISIVDDGKSGFHCFSCGLKGTDLADLLLEVRHAAKMYGRLDQFDFAKARQVVDQEDDIGYMPHDWADTSLEKQFEGWPEWWLDKFPFAWTNMGARKYLMHRGVSLATCKALDIRYDEKRGMVAFPVRHRSGLLSGMRGRSIEGTRHYDYVWNGINNTSLVLYGEHRLDPMLPVVVVEGEFDLAAVYPHYDNVVALFMASVNKRKTAMLQTCMEVIVMTDNDMAGEQVYWHLRDVMPDTKRVEFPDDKKDPGAMCSEEIRAALSMHVRLTGS